jgi:CheY-like chemotaxis protein
MAEKKHRTHNSDSELKNILLVDDDSVNLTLLEINLKSKFKKIFSAISGIEGLKIFKKEIIDVVITDFQMPGMNGGELTKEIKKINKNIPVFILTAFHKEYFDNLEKNEDEILFKPLNFDALFYFFRKYNIF